MGPPPPLPPTPPPPPPPPPPIPLQSGVCSQDKVNKRSSEGAANSEKERERERDGSKAEGEGQVFYLPLLFSWRGKSCSPPALPTFFYRSTCVHTTGGVGGTVDGGGRRGREGGASLPRQEGGGTERATQHSGEKLGRRERLVRSGKAVSVCPLRSCKAFLWLRPKGRDRVRRL